MPLSDELLRALRSLAAEKGELDPDDWLFPDQTGEYPIGGDLLLRRFKTAEKRSSLSGFVIHDMRHSFISHTAEAGIDPANAQGITGQSILSSLLKIVTHSRMAGKRRAADKLAEVLSDEVACSLPGSPIAQLPANGRNQKTA